MTLRFTKTPIDIIGYADSDFAGDSSDRKSTTGWLIKLGMNTISWKSSKQRLVTLSTTEAEYVAACDATREAMWMQNLLTELQVTNNKSATLHQDNQSAIFIENNDSVKQRTKHIDIKYHFIREQVQNNKLEIQYCPTAEMTADILAKPLNKTKFTKHRMALLNMTNEGAHMKEECQHNHALTYLCHASPRQ